MELSVHKLPFLRGLDVVFKYISLVAGENKLSARNAAAEQAIRDLIIKRLTKVYNSEANGEGKLYSRKLN